MLTAPRERQELLTKVQKRFKTQSSETLLLNASRVSDEATSPTALSTVSRVCVCAQSISTRHGVCVCLQSVSTRRGVCVCVLKVVGCFFRCALLPSLQHKAFLHCQAGSVKAWHVWRFHSLISFPLQNRGGNIHCSSQRGISWFTAEGGAAHRV